MLRQRVITAVVLVAALLAALLWLSPPALAFLFAVLLSLAAWEWAALAGLGSTGARTPYVLLCLAVMAGAAWWVGMVDGDLQPEAVRDVLGVACLWWALALLWVQSYPGSARLWGSRPIRALMGLLVLVPAWLALSFLGFQPQGAGLILLVLALVAAADIGAYFAGRAWGRAKLAPRVSPGKSWAGFWGGLCCAVALAGLAWLFWPGGFALSLPAALVLALVTALASVLGDLVESMIKRQSGVKDSGRLLPGHGGVMDRLDSISAAVPVFTLGFILVSG